MNETRLLELIEAYGADPTRWPAVERAAATTLLEYSAAARAALEAAAALDRLLDAAPAAPPSPDLSARVLARAPGAAGRRARPPRRIVAIVLPVAAAAGLLLWMAGPTTERVTPVPAGLLETASLGDLTGPTDALLDFSDLDLADDPDLSCEDSAFGCVELGYDDQRRSRAPRAGEASA